MEVSTSKHFLSEFDQTLKNKNVAAEIISEKSHPGNKSCR